MERRKYIYQITAYIIYSSTIMPLKYYADFNFNCVPYPSLIFFVTDIASEFIRFRINFNFQIIE